MSDDGRQGLTIIAFIGSVFSPYYAWARGRHDSGQVDPLDHCALNVALYGESGKRWTLTERGRAGLQRTSDTLSIGPSALSWDGKSLTIRIDEIGVPLPSRVRGVVRLHPAVFANHPVLLDDKGRHTWQVIAPCARVEVEFERPSMRWSGTGYLDSNSGDEPLENSFVRWDWSRASVCNGTAVLYDVTRRSGGDFSLALHFDRSGRAELFVPPTRIALPRSGWQIERNTRADAGYPARVVKTLEDTPFYARSLISTRLLGEHANAVHESLSLDRFRSRWVQMMLPFRMPRVRR